VTSAVPDRPFLSIGEVLDLLKVDFPDVTISKIRFLESQGLVDPERTPSGYRKFYDGDVERLRWILRQQREHFLPLKVIKDRLERDGDAYLRGPAELTGVEEEVADPASTDQAAAAPVGGAGAARRDATPPPEQRPVVPTDVLLSGMSSATFTREELSRASGCDEAALTDLERYGLLSARDVDGTGAYDEEALIVARLAAAFARHGVEARHLRMYKTAAEREGSFFGQVVMPMSMQRDPALRRQSLETLSDLVRLGEGLRGSLLRQALRVHTDRI
jgi:DNA-binding transcriptional MerR regulator